MTIADAFNEIAVAQGGTASKGGTIAGAIDALNDALAGNDQKAATTIEGAVRLLGEHISSGGGGGSAEPATYALNTNVEGGTVRFYNYPVPDEELPPQITSAAAGTLVEFIYFENNQPVELPQYFALEAAIGDGENIPYNNVYFFVMPSAAVTAKIADM